MKNDRCRSCSAPIRWALTPKMRRIPLDPEPREDGNILLGHIGGEERAIALTVEDRAAAQIEGTPLYVSHFATCPSAKRHRGRTRSAS